MVGKQKIMYVQTSGVNAPERLYSPFVLAATAKATDIDAIIYFLGSGITVVKKGAAENVQVGAFPPLSDMMKQAIDAGVELMVCEQSTQLMNMDRGDFVPEAKVVGAATLNDLVLECDGVMWF
jgi:predicted peroxiredoxin